MKLWSLLKIHFSGQGSSLWEKLGACEFNLSKLTLMLGSPPILTQKLVKILKNANHIQMVSLAGSGSSMKNSQNYMKY